MGLKWLDKKPRLNRGISWGKPWKIGELNRDDVSSLSLESNLEIQNRVMAYWPDGSVKWTGHAAVIPENYQIDQEIIKPSESVSSSHQLARDEYNGVYVDNGLVTLFFPRHGDPRDIIDWIKIGKREHLKSLRLQVKQTEATGREFAHVSSVEIEENGPVKAVVKVVATYTRDNVRLLEYILRFRIYRNIPQIELIHTVTICEAQIISGLGLWYQTAISGEIWNRQFKLAGDDGIYNENAQLLISRKYRRKNEPYLHQAHGEIVAIDGSNSDLLDKASQNAVWNHFQVTQNSSNYYEIAKQTDHEHYLLKVGSGNRSKGTFYVGGEDGGVAVSIDKFWEKSPAKYEVDQLTENWAINQVWLWSDTAQSMDFRHYSNHGHETAYEGMDEVRATAVGIANTSRLWFTVSAIPLTNDGLWQLALENEHPAQIVMTPSDYYQTKVFGVWSLPDRSTKEKAHLEEQLLACRKFYLREVDQRDWYGYWNYGDVMHSYDRYRHVWFYDFGGYAWQNTELMVNIWLWLDFLRTGDADVYYFAEAMTRHTSEVDQYHRGEYKGLGSRHNVEHWGDSCKEVRISEAGLHRYYYYLTGDERIGEIMADVKDVENYAFDELPPLRSYYNDRYQSPFEVRIGPDWTALTSNWFTQWERTGDTHYLKRIQTGFNDINQFPQRLLSGPMVFFDKETKHLIYQGVGNTHGYHMMISFGAPEFWLEFIEVFQDKDLQKMVSEFGEFYALSDEQKKERSNGRISDQHMAWPMFATALMAYAAKTKGDPTLAKKAWQTLLDPAISGTPNDIQASEQDVTTWKNIVEMPWVTTNCVSQWCLNLILCLELIPDSL